jgi:hypothetical protein
MGAPQQCVCVKLTSMCGARCRMPRMPSHACAVQPVRAAAERAGRATRVCLMSGAERALAAQSPAVGCKQCMLLRNAVLLQPAALYAEKVVVRQPCEP